MEGARWDDTNSYLVESFAKELFTEVPVIWLMPKRTVEINLSTRHIYNCPTYKTSERRGVLSTTGHSTNFVMSIFVPMRKKDSEKHWTKRGCCFLTQLDN